MNFSEIIGVLRKEIRDFDGLGEITNLALVYFDLLVAVSVIEMMCGVDGDCRYLAIRRCGFELAPTKSRLTHRLEILGNLLVAYQLTWTKRDGYVLERFVL